ncbi:MAG: ABC transporter substrate-binding protein [Ferrovibrionaceae bacterium]
MGKTVRWGLIAAAVLAAVPAGAAEKIVARMDFVAWGTHAAMHLANEKGWFRDAGLEVTVQDGTGSGNTIQLVGSGQVDVGQVQLGVMAPARDADLKVRSFAGFFRKSDLAVLVDRDSPVKTVADLKGKTLVNFNNSPWAPYINAFLKTGGLDRSSVNVVNVAAPALMTSYTARQSDGVFTTAPFGLPVIEALRPSKPVLMADAGIAFPSYGLIALEETLVKRREALRKLAAVQVKAWNYIYDGHVDEAVAAMIAQRPGANLNPQVLQGQIVAYKDFITTPATAGKPFGWQAETDWASALKAMVDAGIIKPGRPPAEFYTNDLLPN